MAGGETPPLRGFGPSEKSENRNLLFNIAWEGKK